MGRILGKGGFAEVREVTDIRTGDRLACKVLSKLAAIERSPDPGTSLINLRRTHVSGESSGTSLRGYGMSERDLELIANEVGLLKALAGSKHVVRLHDVIADLGNIYLVMELCRGGELMKVISQSRRMTERAAASMFRQLARAVADCHALGIAHRDIKLENVLIAEPVDPSFFRASGSDVDRLSPQLRLCDFGLAVRCSPARPMRAMVGSAFYIAPEVVNRQGYTLAVDVWSLGASLYLLLSGTVPFGHGATKKAEVYEAIRSQPLQLSGKAWERVSSSAKELVGGMLERDPAKRYTVEQVLEHPWLQGGDGSSATDGELDVGVLQRLQRFDAHNRFQRKALRLVASSLSAEDVQRLRQTFVEMDADGSGSVSYAELRRALRAAGLPEQDVDKLAEALDEDGDGQISYDEFMAVAAQEQMINH